MRLKSQGGRRRQLFSSNGSYCREGGSIVLFPGAVARELLLCQAPASWGKGSCQFVFLALFHFLCLYLNFSLEVRCSTFGISVLPTSLRTHVHLPALLAKWYVSIPHKEQCQQKGLLEIPPRNTTVSKPCQGLAGRNPPRQIWILDLGSIQPGRVSWLLTKRGPTSSPLFRLSGKSSFPAPKCNFTEIIQWTRISSWN